MTATGPSIGIVLGGGGIAGYAFHCAVLDALTEETGFDARTAEVLVGTSAGAIAAAILRGGVPAAQMRERLGAAVGDENDLATLRLLAGRSPKAIPRFWGGPSSPSMAVREIRRGRRLNLARLLTALIPRGRLQLTPVSEPLDALHNDDWPQEPLWIPTTDLHSGKRVVFGKEQQSSVSQAVEASAALPGFFAPIDIGDETYVDGGVASPTNADLLVDYFSKPSEEDHAGMSPRPLDLVIILAPLSIDELTRTTPLASAARSLPRRQLRGEIRRIEATGTKTLVFQPGRAVARAMGLNPMDPNRVQAIVARSDELTRRQLAATPQLITELLNQAGQVLTPPADVTYPAV